GRTRLRFGASGWRPSNRRRRRRLGRTATDEEEETDAAHNDEKADDDQDENHDGRCYRCRAKPRSGCHERQFGDLVNVALTVCDWPSRVIFISNTSPGFAVWMRARMSANVDTLSPLSVVMRSPSRIPAVLAGELADTDPTNTPSPLLSTAAWPTPRNAT